MSVGSVAYWSILWKGIKVHILGDLKRKHLIKWKLRIVSMIKGYMIDCLSFTAPFKYIFLKYGHNHCRWRAVKFGLCSSLTSIEQGRMFIVPFYFTHWSLSYIIIIFHVTPEITVIFTIYINLNFSAIKTTISIKTDGA